MLLAFIPAFIVFAGITLVVYGATRPSSSAALDARLQEFAPRVRNLTEIELEAPFSDRVLKPVLTALSNLVGRYTPVATIEKAQVNLVQGGSPNNMTVADFMGLKGLAALLLGVMGFLTTFFTGQPALYIAGATVLGIVIGFIMPSIWLGSKIKARRKAITRALPDAIDLLTISVEAGLGFDAALARVVEKSDNVLTREFARVISEMRVGQPRREALRGLIDRTGLEVLGTFVTSIIQAEQLGVSIAKVLRIQSQEMRIRRRQAAEELAHKAPIKMLFPMVFLIFPPMFIVILGPAVPKVMIILAPGLPL